MSDSSKTLTIGSAEQLWQPASRRSFLRLLGVGGTVVLLPSVFAACDDDDNPVGPGGGATLDLSNDVGILNYAFALEQLEAAFYSAVVGAGNFSTLISNVSERELLTDIRNHEVIHREFLRAALGSSAIGNLALNNATVTTAISSRANILNTARTFEDLGVAAYNGAGKYLSNGSNLLVAGKIVSVEARHAAAIRDAIDLAPTSGTAAATGTLFAGDDVVSTAEGFDVKAEPAAVLGRVASSQFVTTSITIGTQPPAAKTSQGTADRLPPA
jgi:hypothetical protein